MSERSLKSLNWFRFVSWVAPLVDLWVRNPFGPLRTPLGSFRTTLRRWPAAKVDRTASVRAVDHVDDDNDEDKSEDLRSVRLATRSACYKALFGLTA